MYKKIKLDMVNAMKSGDKELTTILKVLVSDIQRDPNKDYCDKNIIRVVRQTIAALSDPHVIAKNGAKSIQFIDFLEREYLPKKISDDQINNFLKTVDFSKLKNKMQAIGIVTKNFPDGSVDGTVIKQLVMNF